MAEKDLHRQLRDWAYKTYGCFNKTTGKGLLKIMKQTMLAQYGEAGAADWAVLVKRPKPPGYVFYMELKNPDGSGECSEKQLWWHATVRAMGFHVYVVDNLIIGKRIIEQEVMQALGTPIRRPLRNLPYISGG